MNIPNSLTILRILLIPVYIGFMTYGKYGLALLALLLAGATDAIDGALARRMNQRTQLGAILDPLADKLLLTSGFISLAVLHLVPSWLVILVVSRDIILLLGTAVAHVTNVPIDITPTLLGKGTTLLQLTYILLVVLMKWKGMALSLLTPLLITMVVFTLASGLHYLYRGYRHTNAAPPLA
ncbi:CDP-alcohol phosphatidyltransferase family protein [Nitrospira moscoviensis]|uniref:CDP-diacylglycerol--glycerol-3-phosphate 3-phosphatidyltransferase n=1 Tax=Nitrospira moscoviensis TaxID=42253 RepID=A0A0K2G8Y2_NITMO|nr:CDP-alcohol phosphatidyltransferase family protein [Nitrospira moscoviensis]ALA57072.1 CDP-diacylglycerol-glycerol-3-phosphate 3-phosphatidyltransferase [Nitrospira moscoviensis]